MFMWKNAIVLIGLLTLVSLPAAMLVRQPWEKTYISRLVIGAMLMACVMVSAVPMLGTQLLFLVVVAACFTRRVPIAGTYFFFFFSTPAAGSLLKVAGAYISPLTPFLSFAGALVVGYLTHPEHHLRRRFTMSDLFMLAFVVAYCVCMSLRDTPTGIARTFVTYFVPYMLTYHILSRMRIERVELILRLLLFGAAAGGLLCIFETLRHWPLYASVMGIKQDMWTIDSPRLWLERGGIARAYGPYAHPLTGGAMLGIAAIAGWALWQIRGRSGPLMVLMLLVLLGLATTLSRSGLVAVAVGLMTFQFLRGRYLLAILLPAVGLVTLIALPILGGADAQFSTTYRLGLMLGVPKALGSHIWIGYREAVLEGLLDNYIQGQGIVDLVNAYVALLVDGGVVSLLPFVLFVASSYPHYRAIRRLKPDREQLIFAQALISIQTALVVSLALLSNWVAPMQISFITVALLVALRSQLATARAKQAPVREPLVAALPVADGERLPALR